MAISYNAGTNTITLDGVNTYTLLDIYNADVAGAWGVVTRTGGIFYLFACHLTIGGGGLLTQLVDSNVNFQLGTVAANKNLLTNTGSVLNFSKSLITINILTHPNWQNGEIIFENCGIQIKSSDGSGIYMKYKFTVKHSTIIGGKLTIYQTLVSGTFEDVTLEGLTAFGLRSEAFAMSDVKIKNATNGLDVYQYNVNAIARNSKFSGNTNDLRLYNSGLPHATFIDCEFDNTKLQFDFADNYLLEKYSFNVLVSDKDNTAIAGASVVLKDKNGVVKHSADTGADGKLPTTWEVLAIRYDGTSETKTEYTPFTLTVSKTGYTDYETKITIDHVVKDDQVVLKKRVRSGELRW